LVGCVIAPVAVGAALPDGRAYELVSPAAGKNGADVLADSTRTRAADDGGAVGFPSLTAFGRPRGTGIASDYVSVRSDDPSPGNSGWSTHAVTPPQAPLTIRGLFAVDPYYDGDYSSDLTHAIFRAWTPLTNDPSVAAMLNVYVRDDMRTPDGGAYRLISACPRCDTARTPLAPPFNGILLPVTAGASENFRHIAFESRSQLTSDAPSPFQIGVYAWDDGQVRYAGYIPSGSDISCGGSGPACRPADGSQAGAGARTTRPVHVISRDGTRIFFTDVTTGRVYVRISNTVTEEITASERTDCADDPRCGGDDVPDPVPVLFDSATFLAGSSDGMHALISTTASLTDDAPDPTNGDNKLYVYDGTKPPSDPHNLVYVNKDSGTRGLVANNVRGVMGASDDLRYVYFIARGQPTAGGPINQDPNFYMWHDGHIAYIGEMHQEETTDDSMIGRNTVLMTQSRVTPDGRFLLFGSHDGTGLPLRYDHGACASGLARPGCRELYVYSADTETLACASCIPGGQTATRDASSGFRVPNGSAGTWHFNRVITDDGQRVFFTSGDALLPEDTNGKLDAYEYDVASGKVHLISSGTDSFDSYFMEVTPSGDDAFFVTRERLNSWDTDTSYDLYDARVGGGFPDPQSPAPGCSGPACQGAPDAGPVAPSVGSTLLEGAGDLNEKLKPRPKQCKRGFVKRRVRGRSKCVRRRSKHRHSKKRAAKRAGTKHQRRAQ
jgi:hypothetical protein